MGLSLALYQYIKDKIQLRLIGDGKYGKVYKLKGENGKLLTVERVDKTSFKAELNYGKKLETELRNLMLLEHPNLLRFFHMDRLVTPWWYDPRELRYEYLENGTNLQRYLSDNPQELDWQTCYGIIKGICDGLAYLHTGQEEPIYHLDISPRCIMLDKSMTPKLQYVSLSKFLYPAITWKKDRRPDHGTPGYRPPEYLLANTVSEKFDVFSFGVVMINILTGVLTGYEQICKMPPEKIIDLAQKNWRKILEDKRSGVSQLELYCQQVTKCTKIALSCLERDMDERPNVREIIKRLNEPDDPQSKILQRLQELFVTEDSTSREDGISIELNSLERGEEPINLGLPVLQLITANFSDELKVGHGGCGAVYKGIMEHGTIAVKKLFNTHTIDEKMFHQEVTSLMLVRHQNIVRFLGYCSHTEEKAEEIMPGIFVLVEERKRMLCFEYISNGSLEDRITDELRGLEWNTRYQIIKGICDGLCHLHAEKHIIHMDLKPSNILLDDSMVPKITDFGLSRLDDKTQTTSAEPLMTLGYCAPEYQFHGKMSSKSDIYSLGVIILEIVTGRKEKPDIGKVLKRWKHRWNKSAADTLLAYKQVDTCLDVAKRCMHDDPTDRPNISDIVDDLNKIDSTEEAISDAAEYLKLEEMLQIEPLEMHLTFELNKRMSCSIELTNNTDGYFAFRISTTSLRPYHIHPTKGIVPPRSKRSVTIALQALEKTPSYNYRKDEFSVQSTTVDDSLTVTDISGSMFNEKSGNVVDDVNLTVVLDV